MYLSYIEIYNKEKEKLKNVPSSSSNAPDVLEEYLINRNMIYNAMAKVHLGIYQKDKNGFLESFDIFQATNEAKVHALKYSVDLLQLAKVIKSEIKLDDVINFYNKTLPTIKSINEQIIAQLEYGLLNKDIKLLKRYVKIAEKQLINDNNESIARLIIDANNIIFKYEMKSKKQLVEEGRKEERRNN